MLLKLNIKSGIIATWSAAQTSGKGLSIKGQVFKKNVSTSCRVRLFEKNSGRLIADKLTDQNGNYEFDHLTKTNFFIIAHDFENQFNAVIQDNVVPK